MNDFGLSIVVALTGWWFFTGLILWLVHWPAKRHRRVFVMTSMLSLATFATVPSVAAWTGGMASVVAFSQALILWGWLEMAYLMGFMTGPEGKPCQANAGLRVRAICGLKACLYNELGTVGVGMSLVVMLWDAANPTAMLAFCALWFMRWSAKLNLVLGVRNYNRSWLPQHLAYVDSYIPRRRMNPLFPLSLLAGALLTWWLGLLAAGAPDLGSRVAFTLVCTLVLLGTLEHVFLMLPLNEAALWRWASPDPNKKIAISVEKVAISVEK